MTSAGRQLVPVLFGFFRAMRQYPVFLLRKVLFGLVTQQKTVFPFFQCFTSVSPRLYFALFASRSDTIPHSWCFFALILSFVLSHCLSFSIRWPVYGLVFLCTLLFLFYFSVRRLVNKPVFRLFALFPYLSLIRGGQSSVWPSVAQLCSLVLSCSFF